jgi:hypothetical protein
MAVRLRIRSTVLTALGMASVILMVGALFPAVGDSIGKLDLPKGVSELLGGADYGTITGWMRSEIGAVYGPLVIAATAITAAAGSTAGEEESGILGLVLAQPIGRSRLVLEKAGAVAIGVLVIAGGTWLGLVVGVAVAGGGIPLGHQAALAVHLAFFGFTNGAVALALAGITGRRAVAAGWRRSLRGRRLPDQRLCATPPWGELAEVRLTLLLLRWPRPARQRDPPGRPGRASRRHRRTDVHRGGEPPAPGPARMSGSAHGRWLVELAR